jgi:hypothetical protein
MLQRLQPQNPSLLSDIDRYFDSPLVSVADTKDPDWLCNWWRMHFFYRLIARIHPNLNIFSHVRLFLYLHVVIGANPWSV